MHGSEGGRPARKHTRGTGSGFASSNRMAVGAVHLKFENKPSEAHSICVEIDKCKKVNPDKSEQEVFEHVGSLFRKHTDEQIIGIYAAKEKWRDIVQAMGLGTQEHNKHMKVNLGFGEKKDKADVSLRSTVGIRKTGGGAKLKLVEIFSKTHAWFVRERLAGNFVDKIDLVLEWTFHAQILLKQLWDKRSEAETDPELEKLTAKEEEQFITLTKKFEWLSKNRSNTRDFAKEIGRRLGARLLMPQRLCMLTPQEEAHRFKCTIQCQDEMMWIIAFGEKEELAKHVSDPDLVIRLRKDCVLLFSDQVPWWVKVKSSRQLYTSSESQARSKRARRDVGPQFQDTQTVMNMDDDDDDDGQTQKRGHTGGVNDKYRITLVLLQIVWNFFDAEKDPVGQFGPSVLILIGYMRGQSMVTSMLL